MVLGSLSAGRWTPGIGDPTLLGWLTVLAYLIGAALCWRRAVIIRGVRWPSYGRGEPLFWLVCTVFLLALGINKQLDLQTWFTVFGKELAKDMGWYAERRIVQGAFVALLGMAGLVLTAVGMWWTKQLSVASRVAFAGAVFLGIFIMVRAASFHHVDQMLGVRLAGLRLNVLLEMGGIACMGVAAASILKSSQKDIAKGASRPHVTAF